MMYAETIEAASDAEIINEILNGDKEKYALLIRRYNQRLYRVCKGFVKDEQEVEDLMQDTYIKAYLNLAAFEGRSLFSTWLTRILINESLQRVRSLNKQSHLVKGSNLHEMDLSDNNTPEHRSLQKELKLLIEKKVEDLPPNYRSVFMLREVEKLNVAQTSAALMISESNVKVRLNRAKEMLRKSLADECPVEELFEFHLLRCARVGDGVMRKIS